MRWPTRASGCPDVTAAESAAPPERLGRSGQPRWFRLRLLTRMPLPFACALILAFLVLVAVIGAPFAFDAANQQNLSLRFAKPFNLDHGWLYVLGADSLGRSVLAEIFYGTRSSFFVAGSSVALATAFGFLIGLVCGYRGGWLDASAMRVGDIIVTLPSLLMALGVLFVLGPSATNLILVLAVARLPVFMRTARAQALAIREWTFIEAARSIGSSTVRIMWQDVRPLVTPTIMTVAMLEIANVMLAVAGLSFLGVGLQRPNVDWGTMVAEGRQYLAVAWWVTLFPGLAIMVTALSANIVSNWLRAVGDPLQSGVMIATTAAWRKSP
jgi:peptide/nickel transport system permease protein